MAGAGNRELEAVDVKAFLVGVCQKADKVLLLEAMGREVGVEITAWRSYNQSLYHQRPAFLPLTKFETIASVF